MEGLGQESQTRPATSREILDRMLAPSDVMMSTSRYDRDDSAEHLERVIRSGELDETKISVILDMVFTLQRRQKQANELIEFYGQETGRLREAVRALRDLVTPIIDEHIGSVHMVED